MGFNLKQEVQGDQVTLPFTNMTLKETKT